MRTVLIVSAFAMSAACAAPVPKSPPRVSVSPVQLTPTLYRAEPITLVMSETVPQRLVMEAALLPRLEVSSYRRTLSQALERGLQEGFVEVSVAPEPDASALSFVVETFRPDPVKTGNVPVGPDEIRREMRFDIDYRLRLEREGRVLARVAGRYTGHEQSWRGEDLLPMLGRASHRALRTAADELMARATIRPAQAPTVEQARSDEAVAVLPLRSEAVDDRVLSVLNELLVVAMDERSPHRIVGTADIRALLDHEQLKDALGCDDVTCATEIGGALGVDHILAGHVGVLGDTLVITLHQVNVLSHSSEARSKATVLNEEPLYPRAIDVAVERLHN